MRYGGLSLQIPPQAHRHHFVKATGTVRHYEDGTLAIFHGPRCLARYRPDGRRSPKPAPIATPEPTDTNA